MTTLAAPEVEQDQIETEGTDHDTTELVGEDEVGRDLTEEDLADFVEKRAAEQEKILSEKITKEELERRQREADANHEKYLREREQRAARDEKLMRIAPAVQRLLRCIDDGLAGAQDVLAQTAAKFFAEVPGFDDVKDAETKIIEFARNEQFLNELRLIDGHRVRLVEFFRENGEALQVIEIGEEMFNLAREFNRDVEDARKRRQRGQNFSGWLASLKRIKLLTFSYKEGGEKKSIAFMAMKPFAFKLLCEAETAVNADARRQQTFWKVWKQNVLPNIPEDGLVSITDLFTSREVREARSAVTMSFTPDRGSDERQLVGLVFCRIGKQVCLESVVHEEKPGVPNWFGEFMSEDLVEGDDQWSTIDPDPEDPDLSELPKLIARAVRIAMLQEGHKFPQRSRRRDGGKAKYAPLLAAFRK